MHVIIMKCHHNNTINISFTSHNYYFVVVVMEILILSVNLSSAGRDLEHPFQPEDSQL